MREHGIWCSTVDSEEEIWKMHRILGEDCKKCRTVIRLWVDDSHSKVALGSKFGCHLEEVPAILQAMKDCEMPAVGVSFHVGSGNRDERAYEGAICNAHQVFDMAKKYGFTMNLLDMGGGWSGMLGGEEHVNSSLQLACSVIREALEKYGFNKVENLKLISEPGRYFNEQTIHMACAIERVSKKGDRTVYRINEGVMGVFKDLLLADLKVNAVPLVDCDENTPLYKSSIIGPSNRDNDVILQEAMLPAMKVGDHILFTGMGAYTLSLTTLTLRHAQKYVYFVHKSSLLYVSLNMGIPEHMCDIDPIPVNPPHEMNYPVRIMDIIHSSLEGVPCEYKILEKLGEGGFSKVYKCERTMNHQREIFVGTTVNSDN